MIKIDPHDRIDLTGPWAGPRQACATTKSSVIYLAEVLRIRREQRLGAGISGPDAEPSNVVYMSRGPRPRQRV